MTGARFVVQASFDVPGRGGLLVAGAVTEGSISAGDVLRGPEPVGARRVLSVEFASPADRQQDRVTLVLDGPRDPIPSGITLESDPPPPGADPLYLRGVTVFSIGEAHDDTSPAFVVDPQAYDDPAQASLDVREAGEYLTRARIIHDVEHRSGPGAASPGLPSWREFRQRHVVEGEPLPVRAASRRLRTPPGWQAMSAEVDRAHDQLRTELAAILRDGTGCEPSFTWDGGPTRHGPASVDLSEERYAFSFVVSVRGDLADPSTTLERLGEALQRSGWQVGGRVSERDGVRIVAERDGFRMSALAKASGVEMTLRSPLYRAPADPSGPGWVTEPHPSPGQEYGRAGHTALA